MSELIPEKTFVLQADDFVRTWDELGNTIALEVELSVDGDKKADEIQKYLIDSSRLTDRIFQMCREKIIPSVGLTPNSDEIVQYYLTELLKEMCIVKQIPNEVKHE